MLWERCCVSYKDAVEASAGRAARIELCTDLEVGGTTPSGDCIRECLSAGLPVNVLVRPRGGDFVFSADEVEEMLESIRICGANGANGVVIGALLRDGGIDMETMRLLVGEARKHGLSVTFHRAFDRCSDPLTALEEIIELGCDRLLTSGQRPTAAEGRVLIARLVRQAAGRIIVMPGSGVTPDNADFIAAHTGAVELHGTKLF